MPESLPEVGRKVQIGENKWNVLKHMYDGIFSQVYMLNDTNNTNRYAMKVEKTVGCERPVLKLDVCVLSCLKGVRGFPNVIHTGRTCDFKYIIMKLVGPDIGTLLWNSPGRRFSASTTYNIAFETLTRLESLHDAGWLNRDVKSSNFAVGLGKEASIIYMLDFGLSRRYRRDDGTSIRRRPTGPCVGTFPYAPLAAHLMKDQRTKDDLEGWFYMLLEMLRGCLPWYNDEVRADYSLTREWKLYTRGAFNKEIFSLLPIEWNTIFNEIINTGCESRPKYHMIRHNLHSIVNRFNVDLKLPFDWQTVPCLVSIVRDYSSPLIIPHPPSSIPIIDNQKEDNQLIGVECS